MSNISNTKTEQNNSVAIMLDETWMDKSTLNTSTSFQSKLDEIKTKAKTRTPTGKLNGNNIQMISNPKMLSNIKSDVVAKENITDTDDTVPNTTEYVNSVSTNSVNINNLSEINTRYNNFIPRYSDDFSQSNRSNNSNNYFSHVPYHFQTKFLHQDNSNNIKTYYNANNYRNNNNLNHKDEECNVNANNYNEYLKFLLILF